MSKAFLPEETELDKLRDAIPKDAKDQIYGVTKLVEAWDIILFVGVERGPPLTAAISGVETLGSGPAESPDVVGAMVLSPRNRSVCYDRKYIIYP